MTIARFWTIANSQTQIREGGGKPDGGSPPGGNPGNGNGGGGGGPFRGGGGGWGKGGKDGGGGAWTPNDLSAGASLEAWYDFSDLSTLFQSNDGTNPVTADGQEIQYAEDKSGNGNSISRLAGWIENDAPLYKTDGTLSWADYAGRFGSSGSRLGSVNLTAHLFTASGGWIAIAYEMRAAESNDFLLGEQVVGTDFRQISVLADTRATPNRFAVLNTGAGDVYINYPSEQAADVRTVIMNNESGTLKGYKDGSVLASTMASGELTGTTRIDLGWREGSHGTLNLNGKIFEALAGSGTLTAQDISDLTTYLMGKAGL